MKTEEIGWSDDEYGWSDEEYALKGKPGDGVVSYVIHDYGMSDSESDSEPEPEPEWKLQSEWKTSYKFDVDDMEIGGPAMIYPGLDLDHYSYRHAHVRDFSKTALANYNRDNGHRYEFVELVEAFVTCDSGTHVVTTIFKATQRDDHLSMASFEAETYTPSRSLTDSNLDIKVVRLHSGSHSGFPAPHSHQSNVPMPEKLHTRVERLQISA
ncbi:uncharacterized protein LOC141676995 [Apium graveolens]|uniref:uncharacterized protein LOC141676995 n=1 Tax=Apium graveolens TaxID=4045 RepID=UPI003D7C02FD